MKIWPSPRQMKVCGVGKGAVTRPTGRREYVPVGSTAAFPAADACRSSNRTLLGTGISVVPTLQRGNDKVHLVEFNQSLILQ